MRGDDLLHEEGGRHRVSPEGRRDQVAVVGDVEDKVVEHRVPRMPRGRGGGLFRLEAPGPRARALGGGDEVNVAALEGVVVDVCADGLVDGEGLELRVAEDDGWGGLVGCVERGKGGRRLRGLKT